MIPHFLVFSFLRDFEKIKIKTSSGYEKSERGPTDKPGWTQNDYSWTPGLWTLQEGWGSWWISCVLSQKTWTGWKIFGEVFGGDPVGWGHVGGILMTLCWRQRLEHSGNTSYEKELVFELLSHPHIPWPDAYPSPYCGPGNSGYKVWMSKLDAQIKNYPVGIRKG